MTGITDDIKKQVLESLLQEMETREVDGMGKDPVETATDAGDKCPYCDMASSEDNPACSMHSVNSGPPAAKPKMGMKIKIGGGKGSY
jgi:hypothetical protein